MSHTCRDACWIANTRWWGKHSRRMHNPQFYVSGKRSITRILHERHGDSSTQQLVRANSKDNQNLRITGLFLKGIHWSRVYSSHKGPVMWKAFLFYSVIVSAIHSVYRPYLCSHRWLFNRAPIMECLDQSTVKPVYNDHIMGYFFSAFWSSSRWLALGQKAEIVSKSKLVPSAFIKTYNWINHRW